MTSSSEEGPPPPTPGGKGGRKLDKGKLISQLSIDQRDLRVSVLAYTCKLIVANKDALYQVFKSHNSV